MYATDFKERLKKARNNAGFTQREVEAETGIKQSTLAGYEIGRTQPDIETLSKLIDFYGEDANYILGTRGRNK
jgi:transcriptional regulator with XRE-family HTH domain